MNVLRDTAILNLQRNNVEVLDEQLRQSPGPFSKSAKSPAPMSRRPNRGWLSARSQVTPGRSQSAAQYRPVSSDFIGSQPRELGAGARPRAPDSRPISTAALHFGLTEESVDHCRAAMRSTAARSR